MSPNNNTPIRGLASDELVDSSLI